MENDFYTAEEMHKICMSIYSSHPTIPLEVLPEVTKNSILQFLYPLFCQVKHGLEVDFSQGKLGITLYDTQVEFSIARALMDPKTRVKKLYLTGNSITGDGVMALANAMKRNSTLEMVNLDSNGFGDEGTMALAEALICSSTHQVLWRLLNEYKMSFDVFTIL